jgi:hypothetical protein
MFCGSASHLWVSAERFSETIFPDMPWSIMSSDLSTSTGKRWPPVYQEDETVVRLFRIPDQFVELPCPDSFESCEAVALSSRGNILLVNSNGSAHLWTATHGYQNLITVLAADGVTLEGPLYAIDMSDDGRVIIGVILGELGTRWFRAVLPRRVYADP